MISSRSLFWSLFLWSLIFAYTWLTHIEAAPKWRMIPMCINILSSLLLSVFLTRQYTTMKPYLLALGWSVFISSGIMLRLLNIINELALSLYISTMTCMAAVVWCILSHSQHVTEGGFHWYVWIMLLVLTLCSAFNNTSPDAQLVYIIACTVTLIAHCAYISHTIHIQPSGTERCRHLFRVISAFALITSLIISSILLHSDSISKNTWQESIIGIEIASAITIVIDSMIGFSQKTIKQQYSPVHNDVI